MTPPNTKGGMREKETITRGQEACMIRDAYDNAEGALRLVGKLLRTTHAGEFLWSGSHKTAISGLCVVVRNLRQSVPYYDDSPLTPPQKAEKE